MEKKGKIFTAIAQFLGLVGFAVAAISSASQKAAENVNSFREGFEIITGTKLTGENSDKDNLQIDSIFRNQPDLAFEDLNQK